MHSELVAGFLSAWVVIYAAVAVYCASVYARREHDSEALLFGVFSVALALYNVGCASTAVASDLLGLHAALAISSAGQIAASALLLQFTLVHAGAPRPRALLLPLYGAALVFLAGSQLGYAYRFEVVATGPAGLEVETIVPVSLVAVPFALFSIVTVALSTAVLWRSFFRSRVEGFGSLLGVIVLAGTQVHDAMWAFGAERGTALGPFGYSAFVLGVLVSLLWRYTTLRRGFEVRAAELNRRSKELAKANDDLREAQTALVRKEQLAAVGELSAVVAHEVRNPLAIINNAVATLRRPAIGAEDRDVLLNILDEESSRLNRLVGDLLVYARPVLVERQPVQLRELVVRALRLTDGRVDITVDLIEPDVLPRVWGDAGLLRQVVDNLVTNALEAMSSGGALTLKLMSAGTPQEPGVELQIQDTGEGMDTTVRSRAFDPFFTTRQTGTGLGLAIVSRIVDAHGGQLTIRSAAGAGTVMHVFLPVASEAAMQQRLRSRDTQPPRSTPVPPMPQELLEALGSDRQDEP